MPVKSGTLGGANLEKDLEVKIYEVVAPALAATLSVSFCNKNPTSVTVRLAKGTGENSNAAGTRFLEYNAVIEPGTPLERTAICMSPGEKLFAVSNESSVDVDVYGFEKGNE